MFRHGTDHVLGAGQDGDARGLRIKDRARADDDFTRMVGAGQFSYDFSRSGNGEGHLYSRHSTMDTGVGNLFGLLRRFGPDNGHKPAFNDLLQHGIFR